MWVAAERAKRENWMAEQVRSIKEATVRGLEPEIQASVAASGLRHAASGVLVARTALPSLPTAHGVGEEGALPSA